MATPRSTSGRRPRPHPRQGAAWARQVRAGLCLALAVLLAAAWPAALHAADEDDETFRRYDDAYSFAMEAAQPQVEDGFTVREDYWVGDSASGEQVAVRHQMFRGNEYWFWLGTGAEQAKLMLAIYDEEGRKVSIEGESTRYFARVRINPPATGTYIVIFSIVDESSDEPLPWALAYGYR